MSSPSQTAGPLPPPRDPYTARVEPIMTRMEKFWQRVTEGMQLNELWKQFRADARTGYQLYAREVDSTRTPGVGRAKHFFGVAGQFFWAIILKLTPARRVLLLVALVFMLAPSGEASWQSSDGGLKILTFDGHFWGALLMLVLLVLEVGDRVVMKRDLQIAKEIQAWLLPPNPPQVPGLEIAFATRPANTVAGDYYDVFPRTSSDSPSGTILIAIADVAGKSIPAAMLMATFQASLKTLSAMSGTLTELVGRMNTYACSNSQNGRRFTTTFLAEYDPASCRVTYVNAGHNAPILRRQNGAIERLEAGGIPLGIQEDAAYESGTVTLQSGDWLVIFTDGVIEAENDRGEEYEEIRLLTMLHANTAVPPSTLLSAIMLDLDRFVGTAPQHDDVTLMLLRAT
ncbi:MAG: PP2C family protein-serine/threonine phosphatase [Candidatus Korobacteraceae bacterium]